MNIKMKFRKSYIHPFLQKNRKDFIDPKLSNETRDNLEKYFDNDIKKLSMLLNEDLGKIWFNGQS